MRHALSYSAKRTGFTLFSHFATLFTLVIQGLFHPTLSAAAHFRLTGVAGAHPAVEFDF